MNKEIKQTLKKINKKYGYVNDVLVLSDLCSKEEDETTLMNKYAQLVGLCSMLYLKNQNMTSEEIIKRMINTTNRT